MVNLFLMPYWGERVENYPSLFLKRHSRYLGDDSILVWWGEDQAEIL